MSVAEPQPAVPKPGVVWYRFTPDRLIVGLVLAECLLWLSDRLGWPAWHKGYAVLAAVASVSAVLLTLIVWFLIALVSHRRFQFSIRALLVLVVAVALPCSWVMATIRDARGQRRAVQWIDSVHRSVQYDWQRDGRSGPLGPPFLRRTLGDDFFNGAVRVCFNAGEVTDVGLEQLRHLDSLEALWLDATKITDAGLANIDGLPRLRELSLGYNQLTDDGMKHLSALHQLQDLDLRGTEVTDVGLASLWRLTQLRSLDVSNTHVSKTGVNCLKQTLPKCTIHWQPGEIGSDNGALGTRDRGGRSGLSRALRWTFGAGLLQQSTEDLAFDLESHVGCRKLQQWASASLAHYRREGNPQGSKPEYWSRGTLVIPADDVPLFVKEPWKDRPEITLYISESGRAECIYLEWYLFGAFVGDPDYKAEDRHAFQRRVCPGMYVFHLDQ